MGELDVGVWLGGVHDTVGILLGTTSFHSNFIQYAI